MGETLDLNGLVDAIVAKLQAKAVAAPPAGEGDAIDEINARPPRQTAVPDVSGSLAYGNFKQAIEDAAVRNDAIRVGFELIKKLVDLL